MIYKFRFDSVYSNTRDATSNLFEFVYFSHLQYKTGMAEHQNAGKVHSVGRHIQVYLIKFNAMHWHADTFVPRNIWCIK